MCVLKVSVVTADWHSTRGLFSVNFAMLNAGAYIEPMAANFNALPRPGMVLVSGDQADMIKRHETLDDVFALHIVPERLR